MRDPNYTWLIKLLIKEMKKIGVGVIGASGYTGEILTGLLLNHPHIEILALSSRQLEGEKVSHVFTELNIETDLKFISPDEEIFNQCDAIFLCTPHGNSMNLVKNFIINEVRVIDLSADFRFKDPQLWKEWYGLEHKDPILLKNSVYGLSNFYQKDIRLSNLVAVPGCYPTVSLISIIPSLEIDQRVGSIIIDAKSGITGAGRSSVENGLSDEMQDNFKVYGESGHRHYPEIKQIINSFTTEEVELTFTVQLLPTMRGIYCTTYINFEGPINLDMSKIYKDYYLHSKNINVVEEVPDLNSVIGKNNCNLFVQKTTIENQILVISCLDNLIKGASGQALENFNLMFNFEQNAGLT